MQFLEPELIKMPGGEYVRGMPPCPPDNKLAHPWTSGEVVLVEPFLLGRYLVTNVEYRAYLRDTNAPPPSHIDQPDFCQDKQPVVGISWDDATAYCRWLSDRSARRYRLPSDSEWEYAARGGRQGTRFPWGDDLSLEHAWFNQQPAPKPVGSFPANAFGLHDMVGNAWEWCQERFDEVATHTKSINTPTNKPPEMNRVLRGGSFLTFDPLHLYIAYCHEDPPDLRHHCIGFRIATDIE